MSTVRTSPTRYVTAPASGATLSRSLPGRVTDLLDTVIALDLRLGKDPAPLSGGALAVPSVINVMDQTLALVRVVHARFDKAAVPDEGQGRGAADQSLERIGALISSAIAAREIADLAFVAGTELRYHRRRLEVAIGGGEVPGIVAAADAALHRVRRTLIPLESVLCEFAGVRPPVRICPDLAVSIQVRGAYAELIRDVTALGEPPDEDLAACLARIADRFADLRRMPVYQSLRIADRLQLGGLCQRIASWLVQPERLGLTAGRGLLADTRVFVCLLRQINQRAELRARDCELAERSYYRLLTTGAAEVSAGMLAELETLYGLDQEIDDLIAEGRRRSADWIPPLRRLLGELAA